MVAQGEFLPPEPPNERDKAIFNSVTIQGRSTAEVAAQHNLSTRQVQRIVRYTERWLAMRQFQNQPEPPWVRSMHSQRLEHQWQESMLAWYRSQADLHMTTLVIEPDGRRRTRQIRRGQNGQIRFLEHARRIMIDLRHFGADEELDTIQEGLTDVTTLTLEQRRTELAELLDTLCELAKEDENPGIDDWPENGFRGNGKSP